MLLTYQLKSDTAERSEYIGSYVCELKTHIDGLAVKRYLWPDGSWGTEQYPFPNPEAVKAALQRQHPTDGIELTQAEILVASIIASTESKRK